MNLRKAPHKAAVITGGGHRLGRIFSAALAKRGYSILLHYNQSEAPARQTAQTLEEAGVRVGLVKADLTCDEDIAKLFKEIDKFLLEKDATLQVLVNSAAIMGKTPLKDVSMKEWDHIMDLNARAPFFLAVNSAKRMIEDGVIINISDVASRKLWVNYPVYIASKSTLEVLTRLLAKDLAPSVRVNALAPGLVIPQHGLSRSEWKKLVSRLPLRKAVTESELGDAFLFLIDNKSMTGHTLVLDGGYSLVA